MISTRQSAPSSHEKAIGHGTSHSAVHPPTTRPAALVQRKVACACGGGCPQCREEHGDGHIHRKLVIGPVNDSYEQEADRVAEQVMRMPNPMMVQKQSISSGPADALQPKCAECEKQEDADHLQRTETGLGPIVAPPIVHDVLRSPGQPLDAAARAFMEPRFGQDFGRVRIHTDKRAAESARTLNAHAFTVAGNVVFASGQYEPGSASGRRLLAHELAHVVQQERGAPTARVQRNTDPLTTTPAPERDVPQGNVVEIVPKRLYNVIGFDIASADVSKPGIREGLEPIVQVLLTTADVHPKVLITGHASKSRLAGRGTEYYEQARAAALRIYLISRGVDQKWIQTTTSGSARRPSSSFSHEQKAVARAATIEITFSGKAVEPPRIMADTRLHPFKLTLFGISQETLQHFRDAQKKELLPSVWTIKRGIEIEQHSLRWVERGPKYNEQMQNVLRYKGLKGWGTGSEETTSKINVEVEDEARLRVFRYVAESDPSFRDILLETGDRDLEVGLRKMVKSDYAK